MTSRPKGYTEDGQPIYEGFVTRVEDGKVRMVPWYEADTIGPTGLRPQGIDELSDSGRIRIRRRKRPPVKFDDSLPPPRPYREKVNTFTAKLVTMIEQERRRLGRTPVVADFSDQMLRALGAEMWAEGEPITPEHLRGVAQRYLEEAERSA